MNLFQRRRMFGCAALAAAILVALAVDYGLRQALRPATLVSGFVLFAVLALLAGFNLRKRLTFLPALSATAWMQIHIYTGWFSVAAFLIHAGLAYPTGHLEQALWILYWLVALSGVWGLYMSRAFPSQLRMQGENVIFERIPAMRTRLRNECEQTVVESIEQTGSSALSDIYQQRIRDFFAGPRDVWSHAIGSRNAPQGFLAEIEDANRYLGPEEREFMNTVTGLIRTKQNLDYQWVRQGLLKLWLFIHIPLTYGLIVAAIVHGLTAWRFSA